MTTFAQRTATHLTRLSLASAMFVGRTVVEVGKGIAEGSVGTVKDLKAGYIEGKRLAQAPQAEDGIPSRAELLFAKEQVNAALKGKISEDTAFQNIKAFRRNEPKVQA